MMRFALQARAARPETSEHGYAMAALLVAMSVMAIMLGAALPSWRTYAQREKEAELVFRGEQYARAITLFQRKYANASPPNIDVLVTERFLRKKYKDPITGDDFQIITAGGAVPGQGPDSRTLSAASGGLGQLQAETSARGQVQQQTEAARLALSAAIVRAAQAGARGGAGLGIIGVASTSPLKSFRVYRGRDIYNQWVFMGVQQSARAGGAGGAAGQTGTGRGAAGRGADGRGGRGVQQPPGRGLPQPPGGRGGQPQPSGRGFSGRNVEN
jgi:type II secretory pathway pseudopilin PulG